MKCPICKSREHVELDLHSDGFAQDLRECGDCGSIWTYVDDDMKLIKASCKQAVQETKYSPFTCPTCKSTLSIETTLDAYQFHEELHDCTNCGTICSIAHDQVEIVKDSQDGSFLSATSSSVESDDYVFI